MSLTPKDKNTYVIKIGDRYFARFGKIKQVQTAWSLAGAKMLPGWCSETYDLLDLLRAKGKKPRLLQVVAQELI